MKLIYDYARLPSDRELPNDINAATNRLFEKLSTLGVKALDISDYNKNYFGSKFRAQDIGLAEHSGLVCIMSTEAVWCGFVVASHRACDHMVGKRSAH